MGFSYYLHLPRMKKLRNEGKPGTFPATLLSSTSLGRAWQAESHSTGLANMLSVNSMKLVIPLHFISWKKTPNDAVTPQSQSQFTPKMKANTVPRLLSSLVWIDSGVEVSQNRLESFFHEIKCNGMMNFMEFMVNCAAVNRLNHFFAKYTSC